MNRYIIPYEDSYDYVTIIDVLKSFNKKYNNEIVKDIHRVKIHSSNQAIRFTVADSYFSLLERTVLDNNISMIKVKPGKNNPDTNTNRDILTI